MAEVNPPWALQNLATHAANVNRDHLLLQSGGAEGVLTSSGLGTLAVTQRAAGANMSVDVAAGVVAVMGDENNVQGLYGCVNDAAKNVVIAAADPTNPRRDLIVARVQDAFYSGATNAWSLAVIQGTPAPSPSDPAMLNNAVCLARVAVAAAAASIVNANITDLRPYTALGVLPVNSARRPGVLYGPFSQEPAFKTLPIIGQPIYNTDTNQFMVYDGTNWRLLGSPYARTQRTAGTLTLSSTVWADVDTGTDITLPAVAGDVIEVTLDGLYGIVAGEQSWLDVRCVTSGTYFGSAVETNTGSGIVGAGSQGFAGTGPFNATSFRTLVSGDISGGNVQLRVRYKETAGGASRNTLAGVALQPFTFVARNLGPDVG